MHDGSARSQGDVGNKGLGNTLHYTKETLRWKELYYNYLVLSLGLAFIVKLTELYTVNTDYKKFTPLLVNTVLFFFLFYIILYLLIM